MYFDIHWFIFKIDTDESMGRKSCSNKEGTQQFKMVSLMKYRSPQCKKIKTWAKNQREAGQPSEGVFIVWDQEGFIC